MGERCDRCDIGFIHRGKVIEDNEDGTIIRPAQFMSHDRRFRVAVFNTGGVCHCCANKKSTDGADVILEGLNSPMVVIKDLNTMEIIQVSQGIMDEYTHLRYADGITEGITLRAAEDIISGKVNVKHVKVNSTWEITDDGEVKVTHPEEYYANYNWDEENDACDEDNNKTIY